jgi:hypothetical protein
MYNVHISQPVKKYLTQRQGKREREKERDLLIFYM